MFRTRLLAVVASTTALGVLAATPASALHVRPSSAPLHDSNGARNGCVAEVPPLFTIGDTPAEQYVVATSQVTCPVEAGVLRNVFQIGVWEVMKSGKLREVVSYGRYAISASDTPLAGTALFNTFIPCADPANAGRHTWLVRARINAKTTQDNSDPHPYWAKVDRKQTIAC